MPLRAEGARIAVALSALLSVLLARALGEDLRAAQEAGFIGCYDDVADGTHDLPRFAGVASLGECAELCKEFKFFAQQSWMECWCGDTYGKFGETTGCDCGDPHDVGAGVNCVYDTQKVRNVPAKPIEEACALAPRTAEPEAVADPPRRLQALAPSDLADRFGVDIPTAWAYFPYISCAPLSVGYATASLRFRPYRAATAIVIVSAPETFRFAAACAQFALSPPLTGAVCTGSDASRFNLTLEASSFSVWETYSVSLRVRQELGGRSPAEGSGLLDDGVGRWYVAFARRDGLQVAYTRRMPGYPVWPDALDFKSLEFLNRPQAPLLPSSRLVLGVTFAVPPAPAGAGAGPAPALWAVTLYAPAGFVLDCTSVEAVEVFRLHGVDLRLSGPLPVSNISCSADGADVLPWAELLVEPGTDALFAPGSRYAFEISADAPMRPQGDRGAIAGEEAARTWYLTARPADAASNATGAGAVVAPAGPRRGGKLVVGSAVRRLDLSLAAGSCVLGGLATLWVICVFDSLVSSPLSESGGRAWIQVTAPPTQGYVFTSGCVVFAAFGAASGVALDLSKSASCERAEPGVVRVLLAGGTALLPGRMYAFVVRSVQMPLELASSSAAEDVWRMATYDAAGSIGDQYFPPGDAVAWAPELVQPLVDFAFSTAFSSAALRRFQAEYVAAFEFVPPTSFTTPIVYLRVSAPSTYLFDAETDCSPDSVAPAGLVADGAESIDRARLTGATSILLPGWCQAAPGFPGQKLLPPGAAQGGRTELLLQVGLQSALLALTKPLTDFARRYVFRVRVRHPAEQVAAGELGWSLSALDASMKLSAQATGAGAYTLVGDAAVDLLPGNQVLSAPSRRELSAVAVSFSMSSGLPSGGRLTLALGGGSPGSDTAFGFPEEHGLDGCFAFDALDGLEVAGALALPANVSGECSAGSGELSLRLGATALAPGAKYVLWITVVNPLDHPPADGSAPWSLRTFDAAGSALDVNDEVPSYDLALAPLPLVALGTSPAPVLADRAATVLIFFALPSGDLLRLGSELRVFPPEDFWLEAGLTCEPLAAGWPTSSASAAQLAAAAGWWRSDGGNSSDFADRTPLPLPPFVDCILRGADEGSAASAAAPSSAGLRLHAGLRGGELYFFGIDVRCPSRTPAGRRNLWRLQVWRKVSLTLRLAFANVATGFPLVPRLRDERIEPFRALNDAYLKQSRMLPEAASFVSLRLEFKVPFLAGQLRQILLVATEAPAGFAFGQPAADGSDGPRSCRPAELLLGREPLPAADWVTCEAPTQSLQHLAIRTPSSDFLDRESLAVDGEDLLFLEVIVEAFPLLPPGSADQLAHRRWNVYVSACDGDFGNPVDAQDCSRVAASTDLPTWGMFGYLHVDRVVVDFVAGADSEVSGVDANWLNQQRSSAGARLAVLQFRGVRLSQELPAGSSLRILGSPGYAFLAVGVGDSLPLNPASLMTANVPDLDLPRCTVYSGSLANELGGQTLALFFTDTLDGDQLFDLALAVLSPALDNLASGVGAGASSASLFRMETRSSSEELADVQRDVGQWDRAMTFDFIVLSAVRPGVPGNFFDLAVFFRMPEEGLGSPAAVGAGAEIDAPVPLEFATSLSLLAPPTFEFFPCDGGIADNTRLLSIPTAPTLGDTRLLPALLTALPAHSACEAFGSELTIAVGGRRRGSGRGTLRGRSTYAFTWPVRLVAGRQLPYRPRDMAGVAGEGLADLLFGDEPASPDGMLGQRVRWTLAGLRGSRRVFSSRAETYFEARSAADDAAQAAAVDLGQLRLEVRDLTPVWTLPATPYFGQRSLVFVVFSLGRRAYPSNPVLRLTLRALDPQHGQNLELLSCEEQAAAFRRQAWEQPLTYFAKSDASWGELQDQNLDLPERANSSALRVVDVAPGGCSIDEFTEAASAVAGVANASSSEGDLVERWRTATSLRMTLRLSTLLAPPAEQHVLVLAVRHRNYSNSSGGATNASARNERDMLTLEVLDGSAERRELARSHDLAMYPVTTEMTLLSWEYASAFTGAENQLELEFRPSTDLSSSQDNPKVLGFALVAPVEFRFTEGACGALAVSRYKIVYNVMRGATETQSLFFKEAPTCEVAKSPWLSEEDGYRQNQLVVYMPALVELVSDVNYRVRVPVLNPPLPLNHVLMRKTISSKVSPRMSQSPYLAPLLNSWRVFTFQWDASDAGGAGAPFVGAAASASLGRVAGVVKVDEVAWSGFEVVEA